MEFNKCPCYGGNLDKFIQPMILIILAQEDLYGYKIVQHMAESSMCKGQKPDGTGVYRFLKAMENRGWLNPPGLWMIQDRQNEFTILRTREKIAFLTGLILWKIIVDLLERCLKKHTRYTRKPKIINANDFNI